MFADYVYEKSAAEYYNRLILIDSDHLEDKYHYCAYFAERGFQVIRYEDDLHFRVEYNDVLITTLGNTYCWCSRVHTFRLM